MSRLGARSRVTGRPSRAITSRHGAVSGERERALLESEGRSELSSRMEHVYRTLRQLRARLEELGIPYAIVGSLAMAEHGYERSTTDVDVLLTREGLIALKAGVRGRGIIDTFPGSKGLRDTVTNVRIDVHLAGEYSGDGKPKPVVFPDPAVAADRGKLGQVLRLAILIELKLASGLSAPDRLKDLADVLELIRAVGLPLELANTLDESVREKYRELWHAASVTRDE